MLLQVYVTVRMPVIIDISGAIEIYLFSLIRHEELPNS